MFHVPATQVFPPPALYLLLLALQEPAPSTSPARHRRRIQLQSLFLLHWIWWDNWCLSKRGRVSGYFILLCTCIQVACLLVCGYKQMLMYSVTVNEQTFMSSTSPQMQVTTQECWGHRKKVPSEALQNRNLSQRDWRFGALRQKRRPLSLLPHSSRCQAAASRSRWN